jgi:hypothetical protein
MQINHDPNFGCCGVVGSAAQGKVGQIPRPWQGSLGVAQGKIGKELKYVVVALVVKAVDDEELRDRVGRDRVFTGYSKLSEASAPRPCGLVTSKA